MAQEIPRTFATATARAKLVSHLARLIRRHRLASNRLVWAALAGTLVWFADQPTIDDGYNPLFEMFWNPGVFSMPYWDRAVLLLSWLTTTLFCHFLLFAFQKVRVDCSGCLVVRVREGQTGYTLQRVRRCHSHYPVTQVESSMRASMIVKRSRVLRQSLHAA